MEIKAEASTQAVTEELGARLARHRLNLNLTQQDLAKQSGLAVNTVARIENGHSTQLSNLIRILRTLGLLSNLELAIPYPPLSPIEQVKVGAKERRRARAARKKPEPEPGTFTWGKSYWDGNDHWS
jgi:transcriptional regulator with XRE-family HTH domain